VFYRGGVSEVFQQQPELEAPDADWAAYDPWEAIEVAWDGRAGGSAGAQPHRLLHTPLQRAADTCSWHLAHTIKLDCVSPSARDSNQWLPTKDALAEECM
jgi:hypothetical protein